MKSETRAAVKSILRPLGVEDAARNLRDQVASLRDRWVMARYRGERVFTAQVGQVSLRFTLEDAYSRSWFLPRYAGGRLHEKSVTLLMAEHLRSARCFADVGTNLGWFTCLAARLMPEGRVHGFEMDEKNLALLRENLALNGCENVVVHHAAVSDAPGVVRYVPEDHAPSSVLRISPDGSTAGGREVSMRAVSLDSVFEKEAPPDVIKIDVEGAEMKVLAGAAQILERSSPTIFVEVHPDNLPEFGSSARDVLGFLAERGYALAEIADLREQRRDTQLRPIHPGASVDRNCMVLARRKE